MMQQMQRLFAKHYQDQKVIYRGQKAPLLPPLQTKNERYFLFVKIFIISCDFKISIYRTF